MGLRKEREKWGSVKKVNCVDFVQFFATNGSNNSLFFPCVKRRTANGNRCYLLAEMGSI